ncbi:class I SAM-dependent methyltransferase [Psychroserpens mesophilus]|uniref:class I SAM-dependent methyltransferase n=1 Tax=Psychroserpens mesophilus TaxID=325473 RepID=UPI003D65CE3B
MSDKLTDKKYWENYYKGGRREKKHIVNVCSYYDEFWDMLFAHDGDSQKTLIEIGGYPGRYLAYLANKYNVIPTCLDFNSDDLQVKKSFEIMDVQKYSILEEDFTTFKTPTTYDYVISNGFIEHFKDFDAIMDKHMQYLSEKGKLLIMIPNMKGYIKFYKYLVDWDNLKMHNLKCMNLKVFEEFSARNNLKVNHLNYYGGFPVGVHQKLNFIQKLIFNVHRLFFKKIGNPYLMKNPSRFFSSSIIAVFEKE